MGPRNCLLRTGRVSRWLDQWDAFEIVKQQEPQPGHDAVAVTDAHAGIGQVQLEAADVLACSRVR